MVKKRYCGNGSLILAWDHVKMCQINLFYTTPVLRTGILDNGVTELGRILLENS